MTQQELEQMGKDIAKVFTTLNIGCDLQCCTSNTFVDKFEFNLRNLTDIVKVKKVAEILKICYHQEIEQVPSQYFHFALQIKKGNATLDNKQDYKTSNRLSVAIGMDDNEKPIEFDLRKAIHTLIAGSTGMGKTNIINNIIYGLSKQNTEKQVQFYIIDIKRTLTIWKSLPHIKEVVTEDAYDANELLEEIGEKMESRYKILERMGKTKADADDFPHIVVIIDELADLMLSSMKKYVEESIQHIAQLGRAVNISLIIATQNPLVKVCTSLIKANCPTRIALKTISIADSRTIFDNKKAYELGGVGNAIIRRAGDMTENKFKAFYLTDEQIKEYVKGVKNV